MIGKETVDLFVSMTHLVYWDVIKRVADDAVEELGLLDVSSIGGEVGIVSLDAGECSWLRRVTLARWEL